MKIWLCALVLSVIWTAVSTSTPQPEPQVIGSDESTTEVTYPTITAESSSVNPEPEFLQLDDNYIPKPEWHTECVKLSMKLVINYQYRNKQEKNVNGHYKFDHKNVNVSGSCSDSDKKTLKLTYLHGDYLEFVFTTHDQKNFVLSSVNMMFNPANYHETDSKPISIHTENLNKFSVPIGSTYFCFTMETIEFAMPPVTGPVSLVFKNLVFEVSQANNTPIDQFSTNLAYCDSTKKLGMTLLIVIVVLVSLLVMAFVGMTIYCLCCMGKQICECCFPRYGYQRY